MLTNAIQPDLPEWLHEAYPFPTRLADMGQYRMSFVDEGPADAPPLLLLHGNPTWSFLFRDLIRQASGRFRVIAPDHVGFGLSDKPRDANYHTLVRHTENLASLTAALDLRNVTVVAHGWGGPIGLGYAVANPDNIARLVLCNTWALPVANTARIKLPMALRIANSGRIGRFLDSVFSLSMASAISSRAYRKPSDWTVEGYSYPFPDMASRTAIRAFTRMFFDSSNPAHDTMTHTYEALKNLAAPADILFGALDPVLTKLSAYLLRDALRNSREPVFVDEASHFLPEDTPAVLADTVLRRHQSAEGKSESLFNILS
jgi:pimeloyl-ACP methyl ester carboxylesterase